LLFALLSFRIFDFWVGPDGASDVLAEVGDSEGLPIVRSGVLTGDDADEKDGPLRG
jgi:hypothetical protein